jgi:glutaredoxin
MTKRNGRGWAHHVDCPYCHADVEICHDDGYGYEEDVEHEQECGECGKNFVFKTSISFSYEAQKADCLNGSAHDLQFMRSYPARASRFCCKDCSFIRPMTCEEATELEHIELAEEAAREVSKRLLADDETNVLEKREGA